MPDKEEPTIEDLQKEIVDLRIRIKRIEEMLSSFPIPQEYLVIDNNYSDDNSDVDPLYDKVVKLVTQFDTCSASFLQRKLDIGYSRAARILDQLEFNGIVGPAEGSKPRFVLIDPKGKQKAIPEALNDEHSRFDPMYEEIARFVQHYNTCSASFLQRKFSIGYSRAARILDQLEANGIVSPSDGTDLRKVINKTEA